VPIVLSIFLCAFVASYKKITWLDLISRRRKPRDRFCQNYLPLRCKTRLLQCRTYTTSVYSRSKQHVHSLKVQQIDPYKTDTVSPHGIGAIVLPSGERIWNNGCQRKALSIEKKTFPAPLAGPLGRSPPKFKTGTDLCPCTKFQPNLFSSFGGDATQTDRQTDIQGEAK